MKARLTMRISWAFTINTNRICLESFSFFDIFSSDIYTEYQLVTIFVTIFSLGKLLEIARNFHNFPSIQIDAFPLLWFFMIPLTLSRFSK